MKITPIQSLETMLNLVNNDYLKFEDIIIPLQTWIQENGGIPDDNPIAIKFFKKIGRNI